MKHYFTLCQRWTFLCAFIALSHYHVNAQKKYHVSISWKNHAPQNNYLCLSNGKKISVKDSCVIDTTTKTCSFDLDKEKFDRGLYIVARPSHNKNVEKDIYFNIVLDQDTSIIINVNKEGFIEVLKSPENFIFNNFLKSTEKLYMKLNDLGDSLNNKTASSQLTEQLLIDSIKNVQEQLSTLNQEVKTKYPQHIVNLLIQFQEALELLNTASEEDKSKNPEFEGTLRQQFIESIPYNDERVSKIQNFYEVLDIYFKRFITQHPDSIKKTIALALSKFNQKAYSDLVVYFAEKYGLERIPFQRAEEVFIDLYDKEIQTHANRFDENFVYYARHKAGALKNILNGMQAPALELVDTAQNRIKLSDINAQYTLLVFYDPNCWHCKKNVPRLDSFVRAINNKDIKLVSVKTEGSKEDWLRFINQYHLNTKQWMHLEDTKELREETAKKGMMNFRLLYAIDQTPLFFLLDKNKKIIAKHFAPHEVSYFIK